MKVVILAGGIGSRLAEETEVKPKPMVEIGGSPLVWHIMSHYAHYGFKEFIIALGYKGEIIKRFFLDYSSLSGNITIDLSRGRIETRDIECEDWLVHLKNTGERTNTGGRIRRLGQDVNDGPFMVTYGDGVCDVNLRDLVEFHRAHGRIGTVTAGLLVDFTEKPQIGEGWINGGFMVFEPQIFDYLKDDDSSLEADALEALAVDHQLAAYRHEGFWQCMDTLRDKRLLENLWHEHRAPWKVWE